MLKGRGRAAVLLGLMFAAGLTFGLAVERVVLHGSDEMERREGHSDRRATIERFADQLGVTNEQRARIDPILEETRERMSEVYARYRPEWEAVIDSARARIEAVLTPEQVEEYRALLEERERRERERRRADDRAEGDD